MWELEHKQSWELKNWWFWTVVLEETPESPLDCKEIQPVHPKGDQSWVFIGRTGAEAEAPALWPPHAKSWLIWKDPDAGRDWRWEEKGITAGKMGGWHHQLDGDGVWAGSGRWWRTGKPGVLQDRGSQRGRQTRVSSWTPGREAGKGWNTGPELRWPCQRVGITISDYPDDVQVPAYLLLLWTLK